MKIFVVGSGKLANAILSANLSFTGCELVKWERNDLKQFDKAIIVHAGSGRQLKECLEFCKQSNSIFIELSTGLETEEMNTDFTLIVCPNTSVLLLKILNILKVFGHYFHYDKVSILESHQSSKTSEPGTAYSLADSLKLPLTAVKSVRDLNIQQNEIGIPTEFLDKHAYHKVVIKDGLDEVVIETKVLGHNSYAKGVKKIVDTVINHKLEKRRYSVFELIDKKWL
jgi:4-hydroxy-tetrahydrodipicolinate reductase